MLFPRRMDKPVKIGQNVTNSAGTRQSSVRLSISLLSSNEQLSVGFIIILINFIQLLFNGFISPTGHDIRMLGAYVMQLEFLIYKQEVLQYHPAKI